MAGSSSLAGGGVPSGRKFPSLSQGRAEMFVHVSRLCGGLRSRWVRTCEYFMMIASHPSRSSDPFPAVPAAFKPVNIHVVASIPFVGRDVVLERRRTIVVVPKCRGELPPESSRKYDGAMLSVLRESGLVSKDLLTSATGTVGRVLKLLDGLKLSTMPRHELRRLAQNLEEGVSCRIRDGASFCVPVAERTEFMATRPSLKSSGRIAKACQPRSTRPGRRANMHVNGLPY